MSSDSLLDDHRRWSVDTALAGLPIALIVAGPAIVLAVEDRTLPIYASQLALVVLIVHIGFSVLGGRNNYGAVPATTHWLLAATLVLAIPLMWANDPAAVLAYVNFASGTIGGMAIAIVWKSVPQLGYSWIDIGYVIFLIGGSLQLLAAFSGASALHVLHQSSETAWGNSNFVATCLVVAALTLLARSVDTGRHRKYAIALCFGAIGVGLLTLSRAAVVATCVGAMFFLWSKFGEYGSQRQSAENPTKDTETTLVVRMLARLTAIALPVIAFVITERFTELRAQINNRVFINVDSRLTMYELAWNDFLQSPLGGNGWASFRGTSLDYLGESSTFAHNLVLSMLQISGILGIPYLLTLGILAYQSFRYGGPYRAAIAAAIAASLVQPFFESMVGNLILIPLIFLASNPGGRPDVNSNSSARSNVANAYLQSL